MMKLGVLQQWLSIDENTEQEWSLPRGESGITGSTVAHTFSQFQLRFELSQIKTPAVKSPTPHSPSLLCGWVVCERVERVEVCE